MICEYLVFIKWFHYNRGEAYKLGLIAKSTGNNMYKVYVLLQIVRVYM